MADEQYDKYSKMLELLENGARVAAELAEKGQNPIGPEDWAQQIQMCNDAIAYGNPALTVRAEALIEQLQHLKP